jgi:hypothetical protein
MPARDTVVWVPEAPDHPGLYAIRTESCGRRATPIIHDALQFKTREECAEWCKTSELRFVPHMHMFMIQRE